MKTRKTLDFGNGALTPTIIRQTTPIIIAGMVNVLYGVVDRVFIGHIENVGTQAISGVGITLPVITLVSAFASLISVGGAPIFSIYRGKGELEKARSVLETALLLLLILGAVLTSLILLAMTPLLKMLGATEQNLPYAKEYLRIYVLGTTFQLVALGGAPLLSAQGLSKVSSIAVILGAGLNIILDPVLIFACGLGTSGAAIASVLSQALSATVILSYLCSEKVTVRVKQLKCEQNLSREIMALGLSGFTFKATNSIVQLVTNASLMTWGGTASTLYIGAMSIISAVKDVAVQPVESFTHGALPVTSYNYGAGKFDRVKKCISITTIICFLMNLSVWIVIQAFNEPIIKLFTTDGELIKTCVPCIRIYFIVHFFMAFQMSGQTTFVALKKTRHAFFFSLLRKVFLVVPLTMLLPHTRLGVMGVFCAESISQLTGSIICYITMRLTVKELLVTK